MKMMKWNVYKVRGDGWMYPLGRVHAAHAPEALLRAFKKWPREVDPTIVQGGLTVRPTRNDPIFVRTACAAVFAV